MDDSSLFFKDSNHFYTLCKKSKSKKVNFEIFTFKNAFNFIWKLKYHIHITCFALHFSQYNKMFRAVCPLQSKLIMYTLSKSDLAECPTFLAGRRFLCPKKTAWI